MFLFTVLSILKKSLLPLVVSASMLIGGTFVLSARPAHAQTAQFGMVDIRRVITESKARIASDNDLQRTERSYSVILQRLTQGSARFLTEAEITELSGLYEKDKPTEAEQKRIGALEAKGDQMKRELTTIQNTAKPDEAQTARFETLNATFDKGGASINQLNKTLSIKLQERARDNDQKQLATIRTAVAKVAKAKGLSIVFTGDVAIYATVDITDDVLKEVNK
jgi:Skp family chaperone for outer membrane proteins